MRKPLHQPNRMDEIMPPRLHLLLRRSKRRRCCMINFVALRKNCKMSIKLCWIDNVCLEFMDKVSLFFTVAFQFILLIWFFDLAFHKLHNKSLKFCLSASVASFDDPFFKIFFQRWNWGLCYWVNSLSLLSFVSVCFKSHIENRSQKLETYIICFFNYTVER